tara:strand:+ start:166 stop:417 length:252 start_codon:yes stop_codon:yes gene_type:complete
MKSLLVIYFCLLGDVCNRDSLNSSAFYIKSCDELYVKNILYETLKADNNPIRYEVIKTDCLHIIPSDGGHTETLIFDQATKLW